jgi:hypothetical protein
MRHVVYSNGMQQTENMSPNNIIFWVAYSLGCCKHFSSTTNMPNGLFYVPTCSHYYKCHCECIQVVRSISKWFLTGT